MAGRKDYYKLLEISKTATQEDIKKSYHKLAKQHHPDKNPNNPSAVEKFKAIKEAYEVLSDPVKKLDYDNVAKPTQKVTPQSQTRYQTSSFPNFFDNSSRPFQASSNGPKIFTFNVYGNTAGAPFADILKMFFGGMSDFGINSNIPRPPRRPNNPNAAAVCQFCKRLYTIQELINHQNNCPQKPTTSDDFEKMFPDTFNMGQERTHDWRQQHKDTLNSIKRDREKASASNGGAWKNSFPTENDFEYEMHKSGLVQCPTCDRRFHMEAAAHHIPYCRQKAKDNFQSTFTRPEEKPSVSSFNRAKEYAKNLKKTQEKEDNNHNQWDTFNMYWGDPEEYSPCLSQNSEDSSIENDLYNDSNGFPLGGFRSSRTQRKSTLPDIWTSKRNFSPPSKTRRNTTTNIYESTFPNFIHKSQTPKSQRGCDNCIRVYGFESAKIYCSCGFKKSANSKHMN